MPSHSRALALLATFGATVGLLQCTELTKVDWSAIPPASSGGAESGSAGAPVVAGSQNLGAGEGGISGEAGFAGEGGQGEGGSPETGSGGASGGVGGVAGGGGTAGIAGIGGTGGSAGAPAPVVHPTCATAPTQGVAGSANLAAAITDAIVFFDGGAGGNGNRGGRAGLDQACQTAKTALNLPQQQTHAVVSVTVTDDIFHMPENYQIPRNSPHIVSPLGIELGASWNALWRGAAPPSLVCSGVMPVGTKTWLSGTKKDKLAFPNASADALGYGVYDYTEDSAGVFSNNACNGWTLDTYDPNTQARVGSAIADGDTVDDPRFFYYLIFSCDAANGHVLCAAYNPAPP
jgi:hypothetical protein